MTTPTLTQGPCSPWDPIWCCTLTAESASVTGDALMMATEVLYQLSGQRFDVCQFTVRPCRRECADTAGWGGSWGGSWGEWSGAGIWPRPALIGGSWFNLTCGGCSGSCSCTEISEALLPGPIASIVSVRLDGQTLPASGYRVDDYRKLVRLGGQSWPICQDMNLADTELDTWSVTLTVGETPPTIARRAVGELACEIVKQCLGQACALPRNATQISRQGITIDFDTLTDLLRDGLVGLTWSDLFITTYNPARLRARPQVYDVDNMDTNRRTTWP